ncbi:MAG: aminoacyl-histidine dipeptidase [Clostridium argentinense]|uniref:aminoacyl-histidine dipeptidase n=1 Tax=uncultured Clostridium sp. TaxID=59620 RepID=UPI001D4E5A4D|nr:aminoacyl-histidine dipeptidase [Clostridium butanoliproducens]MBS5824292.1 aminoacyl-histidine dipeptidase [Clostridium argentinense]MDU1350041.1 aminoacyl-histidine dipeptidase [Clostridium argentinense]
MINKLKHLNSYEAFKYFKAMNEIPRGSGNEKAISDWLVNFAKERNLEVIQDEALNVIIKKPGTKGYENAKTIILQGHMDMVCEKNISKTHDFEKDPIAFIVDGDNLKADGTTLGADNGIAVAFGLSILDSKTIPHPPIELLVTTEEETGMGGAMNLDPSHLKGRTLINIDSEEEGTFLVSCSGGVRVSVNVPVAYEDIEEETIGLNISIRGLKGGHSGMEINKERGNSNKLMGRFLMDLNSVVDFKLASISGGAKMNAIPREADALIFVNEEEVDKVEEKVKEWNEIFKNELQGIEDDLELNFKRHDGTLKKTFDNESTLRVLKMLFLMPNGVQTMSMAIKDLVQSSTNLGVVTTVNNEVVLESAVRSSVKSLKKAICHEMIVLTDIFGASIEFQSDYPEWQYNPQSEIRDVFERVYKNMFGREAKVSAIHAGLECGLLSDKFDGKIDQISFGPNIYDVHTPDEHLSISSTERMYNFLLEVLKEMK